MLINLKVKTLDAQTHEFGVDNEITVREFKDKIAEKTSILPAQQRLIFCGRVLADERQLKEFDLDGKVLHVAERPPPSPRSASTSSPSNNEDTVDRQRGMRTSPLFRALDSMVLGTMSIPVNGGNGAQMTVNPFPASPSFSMNRITVARHMLECANNIAAYLEDPERGLNNSSLDILARGRWTMESTVVEVGITASDLPTDHNIVQMVQGALSTALRRQGNTNVTVLQLPPVYDTDLEEPPASRMRVEEPPEEVEEEMHVTARANNDLNAVTIEDVADSDDEPSMPDNEEENAARIELSAENAPTTTVAATDANSGGSGSSSSNNNNEDASSNRRRTVTRVLAEVIEQMRTVQTRLAPFIQQFYEQLLNDPIFVAGSPVNAESAQRLYDRVSEALHYMSHAQHAISDLMVDYTEAAPRYLACRPILVEQSGYVSSNAYVPVTPDVNSNNAARNARARGGGGRAINDLEQLENATAAAMAAVAMNNIQANAHVNQANAIAALANRNLSDDPVDDPLEPPPLVTIESMENNVTPDGLRMAQFLQSLLGTEQDGQVQFEFSTGDDIEMPTTILHYEPRPMHSETSSNTNVLDGTGSATGNNTADSASTTSPSTTRNAGNTHLARVATITLPTTSTQTRSTSRPQLHIGGIPTAGWNGRYLMSSFDRFLPCTSHHIREPESNNANANTNATSNTAVNNATAANSNANSGNDHQAAAATSVGTQSNTLVNTRSQSTQSRGPAVVPDFLQHMRQPLATGVHASPRAVFAPSNGAINSINLRSWLSAMSPPDANRLQISSDEYRRNLRTHLENFLNDRIFAGAPIDEQTTRAAMNRAVAWFGETLVFLPQFELPEYDSRDSLFNLLRRTLRSFICLMRETAGQVVVFENRLRALCSSMIKRMYSIMVVCLGRGNAEMYWLQLMGLLSGIVNNTFRDEALQFLRIYINTEVPLNIDTNDVQEFVVERNNEHIETEVRTATVPAAVQDEQFAQATSASEVDTSEPLAEASASTSAVSISQSAGSSSSSNSSSSIVAKPFALREQKVDEKERNDKEALNDDQPSTSSGSSTVSLPDASTNFPSDWNEVIRRDLVAHGLNVRSVTMLSDAYISGMTPKARRQTLAAKPPTNVRSLIGDSVRQAISTVGVSSSTSSNTILSAEQVSEAISGQPALRNSLVETLRKNVREVTQNNEDFDKEKYPQTSKFVRK